MVNWPANFEIFAAASVLGIALLLSSIAILSWSRLRSTRSLLVAGGFLVLAAQAAYLTRVSWTTRGSQDWVLVVAGLDFLMALLLYFAIRKA